MSIFTTAGQVVGERLIRFNELEVFDAWLEDLSRIGYAPPRLLPVKQSTSSRSQLASTFLRYNQPSNRALDTAPLCMHRDTFRYQTATKFTDKSLSASAVNSSTKTLLVVGIRHLHLSSVSHLRLYRTIVGYLYENVLFCLRREQLSASFSSPSPASTFTSVTLGANDKVSSVSCLRAASNLGYRNLQGFVYVNDDLLPSRAIGGDKVKSVSLKGLLCKM